ncbi:MAG: GntR family transcriptional regulator [Chitinivibrionales bacterium]|nr:GntR family transcriptional regulator [Chitinivibrionales bacterium]
MIKDRQNRPTFKGKKLILMINVEMLSHFWYIFCMRNKRSPSTEKAIDYLFRFIHTRSEPFAPLPPLRHLAQNAHVSINTIIKAADRLTDKGLLTKQRCKGYYIAGKEGADAVRDEIDITPLTGGMSAVVTRAVRTDILNGAYQSDTPFPSLKELCIRYNTSFRTLKRALRTLVAEKYLEPYKRSYRVVGFVKPAAKSRIRLVSMENNRREVRFEGVNQDILRLLDLECGRRDLRLEMFGHATFHEPVQIPVMPPAVFSRPGNRDYFELRDDDSVLGYCFIIPALSPGVRYVFEILSSFGKPVAVLDSTGGLVLPASCIKEFFRIFSNSISADCGEAATRFLIDLGHRHIAYLSPFHEALWSQNRLHGMQKTCRFAGPGYEVIPIVLRNPANIYGFYRFDAGTKGKFDILKKAYEQWRKQVKPHFIRTVESVFTDTIPVRKLPQALWAETLDQLFERAVAIKECTAWVCANDIVALQALDYCKRKGIAVPQTLSIMGFDDTYESLVTRLTSYNFNVRALLHRLLGYLIDTKSAPRGLKPVTVDGIIIQRETTAQSPV